MNKFQFVVVCLSILLTVSSCGGGGKTDESGNVGSNSIGSGDLSSIIKIYAKGDGSTEVIVTFSRQNGPYDSGTIIEFLFAPPTAGVFLDAEDELYLMVDDVRYDFAKENENSKVKYIATVNHEQSNMDFIVILDRPARSETLESYVSLPEEIYFRSPMDDEIYSWSDNIELLWNRPLDSGNAYICVQTTNCYEPGLELQGECRQVPEDEGNYILSMNDLFDPAIYTVMPEGSCDAEIIVSRSNYGIFNERFEYGRIHSHRRASANIVFDL